MITLYLRSFEVDFDLIKQKSLVLLYNTTRIREPKSLKKN